MTYLMAAAIVVLIVLRCVDVRRRAEDDARLEKMVNELRSEHVTPLWVDRHDLWLVVTRMEPQVERLVVDLAGQTRRADAAWGNLGARVVQIETGRDAVYIPSDN